MVVVCVGGAFPRLNGYAAEHSATLSNGPRNLIIEITGATQEETAHTLIRDMFKDAFHDDGSPVEITDYPARRGTRSEIESDIQMMRKQLNLEAYPKTHNVIVQVNLRYSGDAHQWMQEGRYPIEAVLLMDQAAEQMARVIEDYRARYPEGRVTGVAVCVGGNVLLRTIEYSAARLDKVIFITPPFTEVATLDRVLDQRGYTADHVSVVTDPKESEGMPLQTAAWRNGHFFTTVEREPN